jgi:hypothetical protein
MDLFASATTTQCPKYFSLRPDPHTQGTDALSHVWPQWGNYAFPPPNLISSVCQKFVSDRLRHLTLLTPPWRSQPWFPLLQTLSPRPPLHVPSWAIQREFPSSHQIHPTSRGILAWTLLRTSSVH